MNAERPDARGPGQGPADFAQLRERLPGINDHLLAGRLQELTAVDVVTEAVNPGPSPRTFYALTPCGNAILILLAALTVWAQDHFPASGAPAQGGPPPSH
ncbi:winged helix-turn-helix transcriptional regulator [Streptomyces sp. NPDC006259]|uniref:winged helix-turn-helix transcriptional regulator n=1 Tax=Streptomyces sp. NPDC006259 TaxID=3364740 RepID=UPI0036831968